MNLESSASTSQKKCACLSHQLYKFTNQQRLEVTQIYLIIMITNNYTQSVYGS
jgi:hypothetical protein